MKKIRFTQKVSEIHVSNITTDDIVIVKKEGYIVGAIQFYEEKWIGSNHSGDRYAHQYISEIKDTIFKDCEFYVL